MKMKINIDIGKGCRECGSREFTMYDNVHSLTIFCKHCSAGYCVYLDGEIRETDNSQNKLTKTIKV